MVKAEIKITVIKKDNGRIVLSDGFGFYIIPDTLENIGILSFIEVELNQAIKKEDDKCACENTCLGISHKDKKCKKL